MTYLEIDIICSRFFLFLKYSSHPTIAFCLLTRYSKTDIIQKYILYIILYPIPVHTFFISDGLYDDENTGCPKRSGHFLRPYIFKTIMCDVIFETYLENLERENSETYFDTNITDIASCNVKLHVKAIIITKRYYHSG